MTHLPDRVARRVAALLALVSVLYSSTEIVFDESDGVFAAAAVIASSSDGPTPQAAECLPGCACSCVCACACTAGSGVILARVEPGADVTVRVVHTAAPTLLPHYEAPDLRSRPPTA